jgi:hypothetical protein
VTDIALCNSFSELTGNSFPPSISPENKQLMSNVSAWMRYKAGLVHGWTIQPFAFISIALFEEKAR